MARTPLDPEGQVLIRGEIWRAVAETTAIAEGERVRVVGMDGLTLRVTRASAA